MLPAIIALAQFAPSLLRFFGVSGDSAPASVLDKIANVAKTVSGADTVEDAVAMFATSSAKAYEFKMQILANDRALEELYILDTQSARARDAEFIKAGTVNWRGNAMFIMAVVVIIVLVYMVWREESTLGEYMKGIATLVLGRFLGYMDNMYNFEFGRTRDDKNKDDALVHLVRKQGGS